MLMLANVVLVKKLVLLKTGNQQGTQLAYNQISLKVVAYMLMLAHVVLVKKLILLKTGNVTTLVDIKTVLQFLVA
jgi:hypothetical protein